jgi:hypothetical protein
MHREYTISTNWHIEIPESHISNNFGRGKISLLDNGSILLAYNETNDLYETIRGKLINIRNGKISVVFDTNQTLWSHIDDGNDVYIASFGNEVKNRQKRKGIIYQLSASSNIQWQYQLDEFISTLPVFLEDSIIVIDFNDSTGYENIYRISKNGKLVWRKKFDGFTCSDPCILPGRNEFIRPVRGLNILEKWSLDGDIKKTKSFKELSEVTLSLNDQGSVFAAVDKSIAALNDELEVIWKYKPEKGWADQAPVFDSYNNAYSILNMRRLVSLDHDGNEKWIVKLFGYGKQPLVTDEGDIITLTTMPNSNPDDLEQNTSKLELFSDSGEKLLEHEITGTCIYGKIHKDNIFVVTNGVRSNHDSGYDNYSVNVYSLKLK